MKIKNKWGEIQEPKRVNPYSEKFAIPVLSDSAQQKKLKIQAACEHPKYFIQCSICLKIIGSELGLSTEPHVHENEIMIL